MYLIIGLDLVPSFPGAVDQFYQPFYFLDRRLAILDIADGNLVGLKSDVVTTFCPPQRRHVGIVDRPTQGRI